MGEGGTWYDAFLSDSFNANERSYGKELQQAAWKGEFEMEVLERLANLFMYCFGIVKIRNYRSILEIRK